MTELEVHTGSTLVLESDQTFWTDHQVAGLRQLGVDRAGNGDLAVYLHVCQRTGLDPFARQIYMIERQGKQTIQTGIDGFRLVARRAVDRTGETLSIGTSEWCDADGNWTDVWLAEHPPAAARVVVYRNGESFPGTALWREYAQTKRDGDLTAMWRDRPAGQLAKCAEALALRKAFPHDLSGVYTDDELANVRRDQRERNRGGGLGAVLNQNSGPEVSQEAGSSTDSADVASSVHSPGPESPLLTNRTNLGKAFYARLKGRAFADDAARIEYVVETVGRFIESTKELTEDEARLVLARLDEEDGVADAEVVES